MSKLANIKMKAQTVRRVCNIFVSAGVKLIGRVAQGNFTPTPSRNGTEVKNSGRPTLDIGMSISDINENRIGRVLEDSSAAQVKRSRKIGVSGG